MVDPYDRLPYTDHAYAESHPDRLAVVARLSGWEPPAIERARVLEVGCARGGNLLPMAAGLPDASFVGVDRSERQIEEARRIAGATSIGNVTFHAASLEEVSLEAGAFDFVICHGVYSWVSPEARRALLPRVAGWLAPGGLAYVSFNTLPGWYERMAARDFLRFARGELGDPTERLRLSLGWLKDRVSRELSTYRRELDEVLGRLAETDRAYLVHEYLAEEHHPLLVSAFLRDAERAGLAYLGDATPAATALELLDDAARDRARALDLVRAQQLVDFVRNTAFRRAVLVRADTAAASRFRWPALLDARALDGLRIASRLRPSPRDEDLFESAFGSVQVPDAAVRRALVALAAAAPRALPFDDVAHAAGADEGEGRDALRGELFDLWLATGALDLHAHDARFAHTVSQRPVAAPLARWHAVHGGALTNAWHQEIVLPEDIVRFLLGKLDGTRTLVDLARDASSVSATLREEELRELVRVGVELLAASGLLVA